jgi:release factor glutamine methyltransferase
VNAAARIALAQLAVELGDAPVAALAPTDVAALARAAGEDPLRLKRWLKRRLAGEPVAYIVGELIFRGRTFHVDQRAYITDPENAFLVDTLLAQIDAFAAREHRPPVVAEFGCGCGSLAISVKLERSAATVIGLELDANALAVAARNVARWQVDVPLVESDLFDAWPRTTAPDFIFGDPPWGSEETLYDAARDAAHYRAMPAASAFPLGGRTGLHAQVLRAAAVRGWRSELLLNGGVLPPAELTAVAQNAVFTEILVSPGGISLLHCRMH